MNEDVLLGESVRVGALRYARGLAHGGGGNLAVRLDDGSILVTPTNSSLGFLAPERISKVDAGGRHLAGDPPSKEAFFHLAVYEERPAARAVVHLHSTNAVAVSCLCHADTSKPGIAPLSSVGKSGTDETLNFVVTASPLILPALIGLVVFVVWSHMKSN